VFALQANIEQFRSGFASVNYTRSGPDDQLFATDLSETNINFGAGVYTYSNQWWAGVSIPHILRNEYTDISNVASVEERHFLISAGGVFDMNEQLTLKPSILYKQAAGVRPTLDINSTLYYAETLGLGVGWRNMDAIVIMAEWITLGRLHFAYMYERTTSDLSNYSNGSHELLLRYHFSNSKVSNISPRLF
jgi:type IX secretion system PorP/SprF family membrane protein